MSLSVGTLAHALAAADGSLKLLSGFGCVRRVYVHDDTVYKVERSSSRGANYREYRRAQAYRNTTGRGIVIPDMALYEVDTNVYVLAMPYIRGIHPNTLPARVHNDIFSVSEDATVWGNVILSDGIYYVIDLDW